MTSGESFKSDNRRDKRWKQRETKRRAGKKYSSIQREIEEIGYVPATFVNYGVTKLASGKSVVGRMPKEIKPPRWKKRKNGKEEKLISSWSVVMWYIYWPIKYIKYSNITNNTNNSKKIFINYILSKKKVKLRLTCQAFISIRSLRKRKEESVFIDLLRSSYLHDK